MSKAFRRGAALAAAMLALCGCGTFPLPRVYILGDQTPPAPGITPEAGRLHVDLKTVTVPDYLDTDDIVRRGAANEVVASTTGKWGERLSLGVTRALAVALRSRLPDVVVESRGVYEPSLRVLVDVERFDLDAAGRFTLTARWRVEASGDKAPSNSEQGTFVETSTARTDAAAAVAMTSAIDQLAGRIAVTLQASR